MIREVVHFFDVVFYRPSQRLYRFARRGLSVLRREGIGGVIARLRDRAHIEIVNEASVSGTERVYASLMQAATGQEQSEYVALHPEPLLPEAPAVKLIAFYLPQFHPIPENDAWWGKGFTEWTNVAKAVPQFEGHYQPHHPGELGFYDLRVPQVQRRQIELARQYGIGGFAFYYYWFRGKRLLEQPLDLFLASDEEFPFCICWANENWTRRWDGDEHEILIGQEHSPESDLRFIEDVSPILADRRYIRIGGRPLIIVYRPELMPEPSVTAACWREYCRDKGFGNPYLVAVQGYGFNDPREVGFDAALAFPPHNHRFQTLNHAFKIVNPDYQGRIHSYYEAIIEFGRQNQTPYKRFQTLFPGWDNEARKPGKGVSFAFSTPYAYQYWLDRLCREAIEQEADPEKRLIFVNAWNEWAEGAHLEPDRKYGYAYLQATANVLQSLSTTDRRIEGEISLFGRAVQKKHNAAVFLHLFYPDLWVELRQYLANLKGDFDLFVSMPETVEMDAAQLIDFHADTYIYRCNNRGRDIAPFLRMFKVISPHEYEVALKLHTKKSLHMPDGHSWRTETFDRLLGSPRLVRQIRAVMKPGGPKDVDIIGPEGYVISSTFNLAANQPHLERLARMANFPYFGEEFHFVAGSMYWFKPKSLLPLSLLPVQDNDFEPEEGQLDGTLAHGLERFTGLMLERMGSHIYDSDGYRLNAFYIGKPPIYRFTGIK